MSCIINTACCSTLLYELLFSDSVIRMFNMLKSGHYTLFLNVTRDSRSALWGMAVCVEAQREAMPDYRRILQLTPGPGNVGFPVSHGNDYATGDGVVIGWRTSSQ